eukprot:SAG31_NODE_7682_length_1618_cov_1.514812_3_plen_100_part_01
MGLEDQQLGKQTVAAAAKQVRLPGTDSVSCISATGTLLVLDPEKALGATLSVAGLPDRSAATLNALKDQVNRLLRQNFHKSRQVQVDSRLCPTAKGAIRV